jgi:hypothetical protein
LRKKKIITVILDPDHDVHYFAVNSTRWAWYAVGRVALFEEPGPEVLNNRAENRQRRIPAMNSRI